MSENNNQHVLKSELSNAKTEPIKILLRAHKNKIAEAQQYYNVG